MILRTHAAKRAWRAQNRSMSDQDVRGRETPTRTNHPPQPEARSGRPGAAERPRRILVLGLGVIGTAYGYLLAQAGHHVEHALRAESTARGIAVVQVKLLDGRQSPKGTPTSGQYPVHPAQPGSEYDLIIVALGSLDLPGALATLDQLALSGPILLFSGTWQDRATLERTFGGWEFVLGYPVAGGELDRSTATLDAVVFDHVMIAGPDEGPARLSEEASALFASAGIKTEHPADMLEWIWIHMAINAAVISTAAADADLTDPAAAAARLMGSTRLLHDAILAIRECVKVVAARGVELSRYRAELAPYRIPAWLAAPIMRRMFASNELTRRIMLLHTNPEDLRFVCGCVRDAAAELHVSTPRFAAVYERGIGRIPRGASR